MPTDNVTRMQILDWFYRMEQQYPGNLIKSLRFNDHPFKGLQPNDLIFAITYLLKKKYLEGGIYNNNEGFLGKITALGIDAIEKYQEDMKNHSVQIKYETPEGIILPPPPLKIIDELLFKPFGIQPPSEYIDYLIHSSGYSTPTDFINAINSRRAVIKFEPKEDIIETINGMLLQIKYDIEQKNGYTFLYDGDRPKSERDIQTFIELFITSGCVANNIDISREYHTGRGIVDFKFSQGYEKRVYLEIKIAKSNDLLQSLKSQLPEYLKADNIDVGFLIIIRFNKDYDNEIKRLITEKENEIEQEKHVRLYIIEIDASKNKTPASKLVITT